MLVESVAMQPSEFFGAWWPYIFIAVAGWLATDVWRWLGVLIGNRLLDDSLALIWGARCGDGSGRGRDRPPDPLSNWRLGSNSDGFAGRGHDGRLRGLHCVQTAGGRRDSGRRGRSHRWHGAGIVHRIRRWVSALRATLAEGA